MEFISVNGQYNASLKHNILNRSMITGETRNYLNFVKNPEG